MTEFEFEFEHNIDMDEQFFTTVMIDWINDNIHGEWKCLQLGFSFYIAFEDSRDALIFKLKYGELMVAP